MSATMVQTEMLQQIKVESLVQVQFSEIILKTNFETIIKILSALRQDMGQMDQRVNKVEGQCSSISDKIGEVKSDMVNIKEKAKETDASLKDLRDNVENNTDRIDKLEKQVEKHEDTLGVHQIDIDKLKAQVNNINLDELKDLAKALPQLKSDMELYKEMAQGFANDIEKINQALEELRSNQDRFDSKLDKINDWKEMKDQQETEGGKGDNKVISDNLEERQKSEVSEKPAIDNSAIDNLRQELDKLKATFVTKEELKKDQEKQTADLLSEIGRAVARLQRAIDDKAKLSDLDKLSSFLQTKLSEGKPIDAAELANLGIGKQDPNQKAELDHLNESIEMLQKALENLHRDFNSHVQTYDEGKQLTDGRLDALERQMLSCVKQDDLKRVRNDLKQNIDKNSERITQLENKLNELRILLNKLQGQLSVVQSNEDNHKGDNYQTIERVVYVKEPETQKVDTNDLNQFNNGNWQQAIDDLRAELLAMIQALKDLIDKKADKDDLYNLEQMLLGKLDEVAGAVLIKLKASASGPETAKKFSEIEKKLFQMYQMLFGEAEDALVVKRPLQKWSCISCDKDLNSYKGKLGNYHNWAIFPPKETSPEKMGKFGQHYGRYQEKKLNLSGSSHSTKKIQPLSRNAAGDQKLPSIAASSEGFDQKNSLQFARTAGQGGFNFATPQKEITLAPPIDLNQQ